MLVRNTVCKLARHLELHCVVLTEFIRRIVPITLTHAAGEKLRSLTFVLTHAWKNPTSACAHVWGSLPFAGRRAWASRSKTRMHEGGTLSAKSTTLNALWRR